MNVDVQRRMTWGMITIAALVIVSWGILRAKVFGASVTATWSYDFGPEPACSAAQITRCIDHFEVEDITNQQNPVLIQKVPNPSNVTGKVDHISTSFRYGPPFGQRTISVVAVGKDLEGMRVTSNPFAARVTVTVRPGAKAAVVF